MTGDYIRNLYPYGSPDSDDDDEDQSVQPGAILNYEHKDELSLDDRVYCKQFVDAIPNGGNVEPPLQDLYALRLSRIF